MTLGELISSIDMSVNTHLQVYDIDDKYFVNTRLFANLYPYLDFNVFNFKVRLDYNEVYIDITKEKTNV